MLGSVPTQFMWGLLPTYLTSTSMTSPLALRPRGLPFSSIGVANDDEESASILSSQSDSPTFTNSVVNGIEPVVALRSSSTTHRHSNMQQDPEMFEAKNLMWEVFSNKMSPPEEAQMMIKRLEKGADVRERRSYVEGVPMPEVHDSAVVLRVGLTFMPGADKPQVTRDEQRNMACGEPDQMDANWRVNTAGALLMQLDISTDLSVVKTDQTAKIAKEARQRQYQRELVLQTAPPRKRALQIRGREFDAVTIDSECVKIVNDLRAGEWDLECTLIEVDMSSLYNLIFNYRHLISRGGPDMSFERTRQLLDTMIEDARRLCVRSPILFRMSTRARIIYSKNTQYGINHGNMFQTLTTSQGIREIISLSAAYYNSLDPTGGSDTTQKFIKPRFLQMIVLLLSLLNDDDLSKIKDFLETTYNLKADRPHLELLFLKVIPLMSINSKVFMKAMVPTVEQFPLNNGRDKDLGHYWNVFIQRILQQGYLLPAGITDLGSERLSWILKWPEEGIKSTLVFNNLQYAGCRLRAINEIPAIEFYPEVHLKEVTVELTTGIKYTIASQDLERITCLQPGTYAISQALPDSRVYELEIYESQVNREFEEAVRTMNQIIQSINGLLAVPRRSMSVRGKIMGKVRSELSFFNDVKGTGRYTRSHVDLNHETLAVAYKIEGRRIPKKDLVRTMAKDVRELMTFVAHIERHMSEVDTRSYTDEKRKLKNALENVKSQLTVADAKRREVSEEEARTDEPISKVLYPGSANTGDAGVWNDYKAWFTQQDYLLHIQAKHSTVSSVNWLSDDVIELSLHQHPSKFYATPLQPVEAEVRSDEIQINDLVMLVGQYLIVAEHDFDCGDPGVGYIMTNYLKITSMGVPSGGRRGMNRAKAAEGPREFIFR